MYRILHKLRAVQGVQTLMPLLQYSAATEAKGAIGPESVWQCVI